MFIAEDQESTENQKLVDLLDESAELKTQILIKKRSSFKRSGIKSPLFSIYWFI